MKKACAPVLLVLLSALLIVACQPVMPEDQLPDTGAPAVEVTVTGTLTATETVTGTDTLTMTETVTGTDTPTPEATGTAEATPEAQVSPTVTATGTVTTTGSLPGTGAVGALPEVVFTAVEFEFDGPESIPAGLTRIVLDNQGERPHDFFLFRFEEGRTMDDVMTVLQEDPEAPPPDWIEMYGGTEAEPGESNSYVVDLPPGNYGYLSFGSEEEGPPDAAQGMTGELTVAESGGATGSMPPQADVEVEMVDFAFNTSDTWASGEQTVRVLNTGEEAHHLVMFRLQEGATFADIEPFLSEEAPQGEPPADYYGGMYDLSPGVEAYFTQEFEPGGYVFICFLPSEENDGAPHFTLGMIRQVTVE